MRTIIILFYLIFLSTLLLKAQSDVKMDIEKAKMRNGGGIGSAKNDKLYKKVIELIDTDSKKPLTKHFFTIYKNGTPIYPGQTDSKGYGLVMMRNSNYYNKVTIDVNPNSQTPMTEAKVIRNAIAYTIVSDSNISFPSKKEIIDTVKVYLKKQ